jgi:hypothetical protein
MPLSDNGMDVTHILGVMRFEYGASFDYGLWGQIATLDPNWHYTETIDIDAGVPELTS